MRAFFKKTKTNTYNIEKYVFKYGTTEEIETYFQTMMMFDRILKNNNNIIVLKHYRTTKQMFNRFLKTKLTFEVEPSLLPKLTTISEDINANVIINIQYFNRMKNIYYLYPLFNRNFNIKVGNRLLKKWELYLLFFIDKLWVSFILIFILFKIFL